MSKSLFNYRKEEIGKYEPSPPTDYDFSGAKMDSKRTLCVGVRQYSKTKTIMELKMVNLKTQKFVEVTKGKCDI